MWATDQFSSLRGWSRWLPASIWAVGIWLATAHAYAGPPAQPVPSLDALPRPASGNSVDVAALAERLAANAGAAPVAGSGGPQVLVFISLSMPKASLRQLSAQAEKSGATLLLRGLQDDSLMKTAATLRDMIGNAKPALQIDPRQFARYGVQHVPTFVLLQQPPPGDCNASACAGEPYASVSGDVTLDYALERLASASPAMAAASNQLLHRLRR